MKLIKILLKLLRILLAVTRPYCYTILDIVYRIFFGPKFTLPPIDDRLLLIPATLLAQKIRKKELKAEDVMKAYIQRINDVNCYINACVDQRFEEALKEAKDVDLFLSKDIQTEEELERDSALLGVPFTCKEAIGVKGLTQTCGKYSVRNRKAPKDGDCAALYRKAGAIPVVVTNVPEFCIWWETVNPPFGRTLNPYNNFRTPGGSTGGEAALIASAGALIGVGNDGAGSIRVPAAFTGVYAHKPSPYLVSNIGYWPELCDNFNKYIVTGPICRYAQDLPILANILSEGKIKFTKKVDFSKTKIYYIESFPGFLLNPTPDVRAAVRKAARYFEEAFGNKPTKLYLPELKYSSQMYGAKYIDVGLEPMTDYLADSGKHVNLYFELIKVFLGCSEHCLQSIYAAATEPLKKDSEYRKFSALYNVLKEKMDGIMEEDCLLLVPTHPEPALHHYMTFSKSDNKAYTSVFNLLGYPATQIPAGLSDGLPIGIQAVSRVDNDYLCIAAAMELENLFGGWIPPCKITVP